MEALRAAGAPASIARRSAVRRTMTTWLRDGEKYALIGLAVKIEHSILFREIVPGLWAWTDQRLEVPPHWREWLGSIRAGEIEGCNLVLLSKKPSATPGILDGENQLLQRRVWGFYIGLLLSSTFTYFHCIEAHLPDRRASRR